MNGDYYASLLAQPGKKIKKTRLYLAKTKVLFNQDNARLHTCAVAMAKLYEMKFELLPYPPYPPDLGPSDFFLFPNKKKVTGRKGKEVKWGPHCRNRGLYWKIKVSQPEIVWFFVFL